MSKSARKVVESKIEAHELELNVETEDGSIWVRVDLTFTPDSHPTPAELIIEPRDGNKAINMPIDEKTEVYKLKAQERIFHIKGPSQTVELRADNVTTAEFWYQTLDESIQEFVEAAVYLSSAGTGKKNKKRKKSKKEKKHDEKVSFASKLKMSVGSTGSTVATQITPGTQKVQVGIKLLSTPFGQPTRSRSSALPQNRSTRWAIADYKPTKKEKKIGARSLKFGDKLVLDDKSKLPSQPGFLPATYKGKSVLVPIAFCFGADPRQHYPDVDTIFSLMCKGPNSFLIQALMAVFAEKKPTKAGTRLAKKKELSKCLVHDDKTWKANFLKDLRLLHQLFTEQSYISLDVVREALTSMPLDDKAREASNARFKCLFEDAVGSRPDDVIAQMAVRASAHHHFTDVRRLLLDAFLRRLENNDDDWTDDDKISLENVEKEYFHGAFREEKAKNYLNKRDKFESERDASSLSGDDDSDSTISDDYSAGDSDLDDIEDAQQERKVAAEQELQAIDLRGYLIRVPHNTDTSENRYTDANHEKLRRYCILDTNTHQLSSYLNQHGFVQDEDEADIPITSDTIIRRYDTLNPAPAGFENLDGFYIFVGTADINESFAFCSQESSVVDKWMENLQNFLACLRTIKLVNEASGDLTSKASDTSKSQSKQGWLITNTPNDAERRPLWVELKGLPYKLSLFTSEEAATLGDVPEFELNITDAWKVERSNKNSTIRIVSGAGKKVLLVLSAEQGEEACLISWQKKINNAARELSNMDLGILKEGHVVRKRGASSNMVQLTLLAKANFDTGSYICTLKITDGETTTTHFITHHSEVKYAEDGLGFQKDCNLELRIKKTRKLVFVMKTLEEMLAWGNAITEQIDRCKMASFGSKVLTFQALAIVISENLMPDSGQPLTSLHLQLLLAEDPEFRDFLDQSLAGGSRALQQQIEDQSGVNDTGVMEDIVLLLARQLLEKRKVSIPAEDLPAILKLSAKGRVNTVDSLMGDAEIKLSEGVEVNLEAFDADDASGAYAFHKRFVEFSASEVFIYKDETRLKILHRIKLHRQRLVVEPMFDANERLVLKVDPFFQIRFAKKERDFETGLINAMNTMATLGKELPGPMTFREEESVGGSWRGYPVLWRGKLVILTPEFLGPLPEGTKFRARPRRCILTNNRLWFQISEYGTYSFITITKFTQVSLSSGNRLKIKEPRLAASFLATSNDRDELPKCFAELSQLINDLAAIGTESPTELLFGAYDIARGFVPGDLLLVCIEGVSVPSISIYRDIELMAKLSMTTSVERTHTGLVPLYSTVKRRKRVSETLQARRSGLRIRWRGKGPCDFLFPAPQDITAQIELKLFLLNNRNAGKEDPETSYEDLLSNRLEDTYGTATLRMRDIALTPEIHTLKLKVLMNGAENILSRESFVYLRTAVITAKTLQLKQKFSSLIADRAKIHEDADNETDQSETEVSPVPRNKLTRVFLMLTQIRLVFETECRVPFTYQDLMQSTWWMCIGVNDEPIQLSSAVFDDKESDALEMKWTLQRTVIIDGEYPPDLDFILTGGKENGVFIGDYPEAKSCGEYISIEFQHTTKDTVKLEPIKEHSASFQVYVVEDSEGNPVNAFDRGTFYLKTIVADPESLAAPLVEMEPVEGFEEEEAEESQKLIVEGKSVSKLEIKKATHFLSIGILDADGLTNLSKDKINMFYRVVTTVASRRVSADSYANEIDHDHIGVATTGPVRPEAPSKSYFFTSKDLGTDAACRGLQSRSTDRIDWHSSSTALSSSWFNLTAHDLTDCSTIDILFDLKGEHDNEVRGAKSRAKFPTVFASGQLRLDEPQLRMQLNQPIEVPVDLADGEGRFCGTLKVVLTHLVPAGLPGGQPLPEFAQDFESRALVPYSRGQQLENLLDVGESGDPSYTPPTWVALVRFYGAKNLVAVKPPSTADDVANSGNTFYSDSSVDFHFTPRILMANSHAQTVLEQRQQVKVEAFGLSPHPSSLAVFEPLDYEYAQTAGNTFVCCFEPGKSNDVTICAMRSFGESDVVFGTAKVSLAEMFSKAAMAPEFKYAINEWFTLAPAKVSDVPAFRGEVNESRPVYDVADSGPLSGQVGLSFKFLNCGMMDYFLTQEMVETAKRRQEERQKRANLVTRKLQTMWNQRMGAQAACLFLNNRLCPPIRLQKVREKAQSMEKLGVRLEHAIRVTQYAWKMCHGNASKPDTRRQNNGNENPTDTFISFLKRQAVIYSLNRMKKADVPIFGTKGIEDDACVEEDADQQNNKRDQLVAMLQLRFMMRNLWQRKKPNNRLRKFVPQTETKMNLVSRMRGGGRGGAGTSKTKTNTAIQSNPFQKFFEMRKRQMQNLKNSQQNKSNRAEEQRKRNLVRFIQTGWLTSKHGKYDLLGLLRDRIRRQHMTKAQMMQSHALLLQSAWRRRESLIEFNLREQQMKKEKAEKLETERRAKRILRVQIAYQSAAQDLSISGYLLKKIRSGASSMQTGFMRQVNDDLQSMYTQRRALLSFRSCFLTTVIAARGVPANFATKLRLELLLPSTVYRSDRAPSRSSRSNYRSRMLDFLSQTENYQVAYTCYTSSSSMQLSDPSNPIWFSQRQNGSGKPLASPLLGMGSSDEDNEHKIGQTFVFPFTGDEICMLRLTLLQETQHAGDIELASGKIDLNVLPFDSTLSPWIDMTVRDTAVKGKAKTCAVKLAVTWLNLKGKQYKRRSLTKPTKNSTEQLSLLVSVTDAVDLPRLAYGRKPLAHVDVSVGKQTYHVGKDVTSHKAAPMPSCEPHWLRSGLRCNFAFNLNSLDDILSLKVHAEGPNQPLESYAVENIETMIGLANIPAYEPQFLNVGVKSSHPIRGIRPGESTGRINIFRCVIDRAFFAELRHGRYLEIKSVLRQQLSSKGDFLTKLTHEMASISRRRLHWDKLEVSEEMATTSVASLPSWNQRSVAVVAPEASCRVVKNTKSFVKLIRAQERIVAGVLEKMPRDNPRNVGDVDSVYSKTELEALPINHKRTYLESRIKSLMKMDAKLASNVDSERLIDSVQQLPILDKPPWKEDASTIDTKKSLSMVASSRMQRHLNGSQLPLESIDAVGNNALSLLVNRAKERGIADTLALARHAKFLQRDQPMHKFNTFISEINSPFWTGKLGLHLGYVTLSIVKHTSERLVLRILTCNLKLNDEQRKKKLKVKVEYNGVFAQKVVNVRTVRSSATSDFTEVQVECTKLGFILASSENKTKLRNLLSQKYLLVSVWCQAVGLDESPWESIGQSQMRMTTPSRQHLDGNKVLMLVKTCDTTAAVEQLHLQTMQLEKSVQRSRQYVDILSSSREVLEDRLMADLGKKAADFNKQRPGSGGGKYSEKTELSCGSFFNFMKSKPNLVGLLRKRAEAIQRMDSKPKQHNTSMLYLEEKAHGSSR